MESLTKVRFGLTSDVRALGKEPVWLGLKEQLGLWAFAHAVCTCSSHDRACAYAG